MNGLEQLVEHIRADTAGNCAAIEEDTKASCKQIKSDYSAKEQDSYWKAINEGTKAAEQRLESLASLAKEQAGNQVIAMHTEMTDLAFKRAKELIAELTQDDYAILLRKLGVSANTTIDDLVASHKERLTRSVTSFLFE